MSAELVNEELPSIEDRSLSAEELDDLLDGDPRPPDITFGTQDFDVDGLVKRLKRGSMRIPQFGTDDPRNKTAGFQRGFVWTKAQMDRFIESLLLGYPVPGLFLVKQADNSMLVLDGQQRLETLRRFYDGIHNDRAFKLDNVGDDFIGLTYESLDEAFRLKLDDSFMHATIVSTDGSAAVNDAVYGIFERLNSGGTQLTPHEIRVALYAGPLMVAIEHLNSNEAWRELFGAPSKRIRDHELVMRIVALYLDAENYARPLKKFLNRFSEKYRDLASLPENAGALFESAAEVLNEQIGRRAFRRAEGSQINTAQADALMVATMNHLRDGALTDNLAEALKTLIQDEGFVRATTRATADNDAVRERLRLASETLKQR